MKFQPETFAGANSIQRHSRACIVVGNLPFEHSIVVPWVGEVQRWSPRRFEELDATDFEPLALLTPEIVIVGTGSRLRFPAASVLRLLIERRIGFECMDTGAACRTFNLLAAERRRVAAALIVEPPED